MASKIFTMVKALSVWIGFHCQIKFIFFIQYFVNLRLSTFKLNEIALFAKKSRGQVFCRGQVVSGCDQTDRESVAALSSRCSQTST